MDRNNRKKTNRVYIRNATTVALAYNPKNRPIKKPELSPAEKNAF